MTKEHKNELLKEIQEVLQESESNYNSFDLIENYNGYEVIIYYNYPSFENEKNEKVLVFDCLSVDLSLKLITRFYKYVYKANTTTQISNNIIDYEKLTTALNIINWWYN